MKQVLGVIEKCSVTRRAQDNLIELKVVEWIIDLLQTQTEFDRFTLEYTTALLMNLVLRSKGKKIAQDPKLQSLKTLLPLLAVDSYEIRTHVNGTLFSVLTSKIMRQEAKVYFSYK